MTQATAMAAEDVFDVFGGEPVTIQAGRPGEAFDAKPQSADQSNSTTEKGLSSVVEAKLVEIVETVSHAKESSSVVTPRRSLFEIQNSMMDFDELIDGLSDEIYKTYEGEIQAYFQSLGAERLAKLDGYANYITSLESMADYRESEAARLSGLASRARGLATWLRQNLKAHLEANGDKKIETDYHRITVCKNGGKAPIAMPKKIESLPEKYREEVTTWKVKDAELRKDLEAGVEVEGCKLLERGTHLRIT